MVGRDIDSIQGRFGREDMDPLILDRATVCARFHLYFFCGRSNSMFVIFKMIKKRFDKDQNQRCLKQRCLVRVKEELLATKAKNLRKHISSDEADQVV